MSSPHNTHGFEEEENEHDVVDKVYSELTPMLNPSPMVKFLRDRAGDEISCPRRPCGKPQKNLCLLL